jgi:hypothetical protein
MMLKQRGRIPLIIRRVSGKNQRQSDRQDRLSRSPEDRIAALTQIRRQYHSWKHPGKDFREYVESLNVHGVAYLVVGGYAVALQGTVY